MTNADFLQAIIARPDEDLPRRAFADWLIERGDPRGDLIRVQLELTNLDEATDSWPRMKAREAELLARVGPLWFGPRVERSFDWEGRCFDERERDIPRFFPWFTAGDQWRCHRGLPATVALTARDFLDRGEEIRRSVAVQDVRIRRIYTHRREQYHRRVIERMVEYGVSDRIAQDAIEGAEDYAATAPRVEELARSPLLAGLRSLGVGLLDDADLSILLFSPHLEGLEEFHLRLIDEASTAAFEFLAEAPFLRSVKTLAVTAHAPENEVFPARLRYGSAWPLEHSAHLGRVERLILRGCPRSGLALDSLLTCSSLPRLRELEIATPDGYSAQTMLEAVAVVPEARRLHSLHLSPIEVPVEETVEDPPANFDNLGNLRRLGLGRTVGHRTLALLASSPALAHLRHLELVDIDPEGLESLIRSPVLQRLFTLHLSGRNWTSPLRRSLLAAPMTRHLRSLALREEDWRPDWPDLVAEAPLENLVTLDFSNGYPSLASVLEAEQARRLAASPYLESLSRLTGLNIGPESEAILRERWGPRLVLSDDLELS